MAEVVVERKALLESLDNDTQLLKEVINIFLADCPGKLAELRSAVTTRNLAQIATTSHLLRGSLGTFGAKPAVEAAQKLESMGRQSKLEGVDEVFSTLEREVADLTSALAAIANEVC